MSTITTPDAWKEMCQLLDNRKQVLDNALVKTLDDKCSASHFQVVRSLMLDQERLLHWFLEHKQPMQERNTGLESVSIVKPSSSSLPSSNSASKRAGFLKPGLLAILAVTFFFVLVLLALFNGQHPVWPQIEEDTHRRHELRMSPSPMAHHLHSWLNVLQMPIPCCIMETNNDPALKSATGSWENDDASAPARPAFSHQNGVPACHQAL